MWKGICDRGSWFIPFLLLIYLSLSFCISIGKGYTQIPNFFSTRGFTRLVFIKYSVFTALTLFRPKQNIFVCLCVYLFSHFFFIIDKHQSYSIIIVSAEMDHYKEVEPRHHPMKVTALLSSLRLPCGNVDLPCGNSKTFKKSRSRYFLENQC